MYIIWTVQDVNEIFLNRQISKENYENTCNWLYSTVLFFLVSQKRPTFFGSILATLLVSATTTIDICCATFFCTKNRESSRRREFSVPDSRTKTGRDVSLLAKLSLFYLSLGSKKISGDFGGSIGTTPCKFKAFEPKKSHQLKRNIDFQTSLVFGWNRRK